MGGSRRWLAAYHVDFIAESFEALGDVDQLGRDVFLIGAPK